MENERVCWETINCLCLLKDHAERSNQPFCNKRSITPLQLRMLFAIRFNPGLTVGELSQITGVAGANISAQCKKLETGGYIKRQRSASDERKVEIFLMPEGKKLVNDYFSGGEGVYNKVFKDIGEDEVELLSSALRKLLELVQDNEDNNEIINQD